MAEGGEEHNEHPHPQEPTSWRGIAEKQKECAVPEWRATPKGEETPREPTATWANEEENTSSLGNIFKTSQISQCGASDTIIQSQKLMYKVMDSHNPRAPKAPSGVMSERRR